MSASVRGPAALLLVLMSGQAPSAALGGGADSVAAPAVSEAGPVADECASAIATRVQARYDGVTGLSADFSQLTESAAYPEPQRSSGSVEFSKPGKMRWEYDSPQPSLVVSDGERMWIVDPEAKEVQVLPVDQAFLSGSAIHFLLGGGRLDEAFEMNATGCGSERVTLRLVPREAATYAAIELTVDPETGAVEVTRLTDLLGTVTTVSLTNLLLDPETAPERYVYRPAEGERVLELGN